MRKLFLTSTIALLGLASTAEAHFALMAPPAVVPGEPNGKGSPPCGNDTGMAATPTPAQGGHPLMLNIKETVPHDGFYRVALAIKSRSEFPVDNVVYDASGKVLPPSGMPSGTSDHADWEMTPKFPVLADHLFSHTGTGQMTFMGSVDLPNVNCDRCVLQVIEFMRPHGFNTSTPGPGGGYFYHHCAELKITADPALPPFPGGTDGGAPDASSGDAKNDAQSTAGSGGTTGTGGGTGGSSAAGTNGSTGAAGTSTAGTTGSNGAAGSAAGTGISAGTAGTTGTSTGTAGSGNPPRGSSGGGCSYAPVVSAPGMLSVLGLLAFVVARRRRHS
jgi:uncharacterized protein (TIGR03382 family)